MSSNEHNGKEIWQLHEREREIAVSFIEGLRAARVLRNCTNCLNWNPHAELCKLHNARPPVPVIVKGCDDHTDEIPF